MICVYSKSRESSKLLVKNHLETWVGLDEGVGGVSLLIVYFLGLFFFLNFSFLWRYIETFILKFGIYKFKWKGKDKTLWMADRTSWIASTNQSYIAENFVTLCYMSL